MTLRFEPINDPRLPDLVGAEVDVVLRGVLTRSDYRNNLELSDEFYLDCNYDVVSIEPSADAPAAPPVGDGGDKRERVIFEAAMALVESTDGDADTIANALIAEGWTPPASVFECCTTDWQEPPCAETCPRYISAIEKGYLQPSASPVDAALGSPPLGQERTEGRRLDADMRQEALSVLLGDHKEDEDGSCYACWDSQNSYDGTPNRYDGRGCHLEGALDALIADALAKPSASPVGAAVAVAPPVEEEAP